MVQIKSQTRVDHWLRERYPGLTGRQIEEAIEAGLVKSGGRKVKKGDKSKELDCKDLDKFLAQLRKGNPRLKVEVVFDDKTWCLIDKPAGMPSHPISLFDENTVTQWALGKYPDIAEEFPDSQPILSPHRLDTGTSGLLIVTKTEKEFEHWRTSFNKKEICKTYQAYCWGTPNETSWTVNYSIAHASGRSDKMVALCDTAVKFKEPKFLAVSHISVLKTFPDKGFFLVAIRTQTGVTHQVRVHLAASGFPLLGDKLYDPLFEKRNIKPDYHQLRAVGLSMGKKNYMISGLGMF